jgi:recombinational DNA repair protein RecR
MTTTTKEIIEKIIIDYKTKCKKGIFCDITYSHIDNLKKTLQKHLQELPQQEVWCDKCRNKAKYHYCEECNNQEQDWEHAS